MDIDVLFQKIECYFLGFSRCQNLTDHCWGTCYLCSHNMFIKMHIKVFHVSQRETLTRDFLSIVRKKLCHMCK